MGMIDISVFVAPGAQIIFVISTQFAILVLNLLSQSVMGYPEM